MVTWEETQPSRGFRLPNAPQLIQKPAGGTGAPLGQLQDLCTYRPVHVASCLK